MYKKIFGKEVKDIMIHQDINIKNLGNNVQGKTLEDILNEFSNIFKKNDEEKKNIYVTNLFLF